MADTPMPTPIAWGAFVAGGLFIGFWLFLGLFQTEIPINVSQWWFWGVIGFAIGSGLFAGRLQHVGARIAALVTIGIAVAMLIGAALFNQVGEAVAALLTAGGSAIIVTALPGMWPKPAPMVMPVPQWSPVHVEPEDVDEPYARAPRARARR